MRCFGHSLIVGLFLSCGWLPAEEGWKFESLEGKTPQEFREFFKPIRDDENDSWTADLIPAGIWNVEAKEAAMQLARHFQSESHRKNHRLKFGGDPELAKEESGWLVHRYSSDDSYHFSGFTCALRFGVAKPFLLVRREDSSGMVGRNPLADESQFELCRRELSKTEAEFLSGMFLWLERIESEKIGEGPRGGMSTTADGYATLHRYPDQGKAREVGAGTSWDFGPIKSRWTRSYDEQVVANISQAFFNDFLHSRIGRFAGMKKEELVSAIREALAIDVTDPLPPEFLMRLIAVVYEEGLVDLLPQVKRLRESIPKEAGKEELELAELRKRFARDHFGNYLRDDPYDHPEAAKRYEVLKEKLKFDRARILRSYLEATLKRLELVKDRVKLQEVALGQLADSEWAMQMMRKVDREAWLAMMMSKFHSAQPRMQSMIFSEVAEVDSPSGLVLIGQMNPERRRELVFEIGEFLADHHPDESGIVLGILVEILKDRKLKGSERSEAFRLVSKLKRIDEREKEFRALIEAEIKNPQTRKEYHSTEEAAVLAFGALRSRSDDLDFLWNQKGFRDLSVDQAVSLIELVVDDVKKKREAVGRFLRETFRQDDPPVNSLALVCLVKDLREFAPQLEKGAGSVDPGEARICRIVLSFWHEKDPATRGRMWISLMATDETLFFSGQGVSERLKAACRKAVASLSPAAREEWIESAISLNPAFRWAKEEENWLRSLK